MTFRVVPSVLGKRALREVYAAPLPRSVIPPRRPIPRSLPCRGYATLENHRQEGKHDSSAAAISSIKTSSPASPTKESSSDRSTKNDSSTLDPADWEENPDLSISRFQDLPGKDFGVNQHIIINEEFKEALRQILWKFRAPIRYAFAYGSGVFPQGGSPAAGGSLHPGPPEAIARIQDGSHKMIDFIFGVSYTQHWHSLNIQEHRDHYSSVASLGSYAVSRLQDSFGAGVYFNPYVTVNGTLIKYGVVNIDTLCHDLSEWNTLYLAGRLQKPVKILRDNPSVRLANQVNLISAVRAALLLLPPDFTEQDLYATIAGISYMGDPRMSIGGDDPRKVHNIVSNQLPNFRRLYAPLIENLPNISFNDSACTTPDWYNDGSVNAKLAQDMDPVKRGNMVRRLPKAFREKLYFEYQRKWNIPRGDFNEMLAKTKDEDPDRIRRREGGPFDQRIAKDEEGGGLKEEVRQVIEKTIRWPAFTQSTKSVITAGVRKSWRYASEKRAKNKAGKKRDEEKAKEEKSE
jgi:mitochondrial translocator assembly and maintenance protein 41